MKRVVGWALALTLTVIGVSACVASDPAASPGLGNGWVPSHSLDLEYATQFEIDFYADDNDPCTGTTESEACWLDQYALITIADGSRFLVVPEGLEVPRGIHSDIVVLKRPLTNLYVAATATMSQFVALDSLTAIRFSSLSADGWHIAEAKAAMESGQILYGGKYSAPDYELILTSAPSLAIENNMIYHCPEVKDTLETLSIPVLVDQSSYESHPLGRTEWIKLYGVLVGKIEQSVQLFSTQAAHLEALAGQENTGTTIAFFYISSAGYVVARKSGDYIPKMIQLAGGEYVFKDLGDETSTSTTNLEMEQFYATAKDADYIIYNSTIGGELASISELVGLNSLLKDFKAVQDSNVWCTSQDFYQDMTGLGQMITDMHRILMDPDSDNLTYLRKLDGQ